MIVIEYAPKLFLLFLTLALIAALMFLLVGERVRRGFHWFAGPLLGGLLVSGIYSWSALIHVNFTPELWSRGWILGRDEPGAATLGVVIDPLAVAMIVLSAILGIVVVINREYVAQYKNSQKIYSALLISTGAAALAWSALSPWMWLGATALLIFAGIVAQGIHWDQNAGADAATRFAWEKTFGAFIVWVGVSFLAGGHTPLLFGVSNGLPIPSGDAGVASWLGGALVCFGIFVHLQGFPMIGWIRGDFEMPPVLRVLICQVFPGWAALALMIRAEEYFRGTQILFLTGWVSMAGAFLTIVFGLLAAVGRVSLAAWTSAGFALSLSLISWAGPDTGFGLALAVGLAAVAAATAVSLFDIKGGRGILPQKKANWTKALAVLAVLSGMGLIGFVGAGAVAHGFSVLWENAPLAAAFGFVYLFYLLQGWKLCWTVIRLKVTTDASWMAVLTPLFIIFLGLGLVWTGAPLGGVLPGQVDQVMEPLLEILFSKTGPTPELEPIAAIVFEVLFFAGAGIAYWLSGRKEDRWARLKKSLPRVTQFVVSGYGLDTVGAGIIRGFEIFDEYAGVLFHHLSTNGTALRAVVRSGLSGAEFFVRFDQKLVSGLNVLVASVTQGAARATQFTQSGDVQKYLAVGILSAALIILYFLKT